MFFINVRPRILARRDKRSQHKQKLVSEVVQLEVVDLTTELMSFDSEGGVDLPL